MRAEVKMFSPGGRRVWPSLLVVSLAVAGCERSAVAPRPQITAGASALALGNRYSAWSAPTRVEEAHDKINTNVIDGCPFISPDGKTLYMASNRSGGHGGLDIWVATRSSVDEPWSEPEAVDAPVNSQYDDFCPTISRDGRLLYFVSRRPGCGPDNSPNPNDSDVYVARLRADKEFEDAAMLPCDDAGPTYDAVNSPYDEFSPFPQLDPGAGLTLYFSSFRPGGFTAEPAGGTPDSDLYWSASQGGVFGLAQLIPGVNSASDDGQPNVGSDGLELFFYSTRGGGLGLADLYVATRAFPLDAWSTPSNLTTVNSGAVETRPSLSWDGLSLYFGSSRAGGDGMTDIYVSTRGRLVPGGH